MHATDPECGASAPVKYQMVRNGEAPPEFQIMEDSGKICIQEPGLDYERNTSYQFLVQAVDRGEFEHEDELFVGDGQLWWWWLF